MGARLRELAATRYSFPTPVYYQVREYPDGSKKVLTKSLASKFPEDGSVKRYWKAGYPGTSKAPRVLLSHPTLPEMDFVDMVRAHLVDFLVRYSSTMCLESMLTDTSDS